MKLILASLGAVALCTSAACLAADSPAAVAQQFVDALQHHRVNDAAAMFAPGVDAATTAQILKRADDSVGGFSTMHAIAMLPDGKTIKLLVPARNNASLQKFVQFRYGATAADGQPVFYELNLADDSNAPQVLSFDLHFPAADANASQRANKLVLAVRGLSAQPVSPHEEANMNNVVHLVVSDDSYIHLGDKKLRTREEVTAALRIVKEQNPDAIVSLEAGSPDQYEAIGQAIYGAHVAGFSGERFRMTIEGKPLVP
ncbi:hypothetical protein GTP58_04895 [Duganella sp. CY15W]|uniref:hypothetical protein n=1 Tax=Duganella sp. CY15W TaxID=2692172 RepID=UPI00136DCDFC|nr:hypothetical protein [Duganella sp. CY15W]MYM27650.1 hypothetical protein [Duganella sp. CY15W]